ncbi:N-acetyltransferase [Pseudomonas sp. Irchel s3h17]|uniref:GNAT family N-acetyltransferase n=1 Tax=Pseudomonas sp. Irchel s3h17 TaxID=2009182 RepID=UPI000BA4A91C|nr:GNAT family N-acetyltransferase [Pseudomonas sp. Irchel s3h17]
MPSSLHYRLGEPCDALCISGLATQVFLDTYATDGMRADLAEEALTVYAPTQFDTRLKHPDTRFILVERDVHLLGFAEIVAHAEGPMPHLSAGAELVRLYVQRHCHRQGLGRTLLEKSEALMREADLPCLWLKAWAGNLRARDFYHAQGYEDIGGTHYEFGGNAYENRVFSKQLSTR